MESLLAAPRRVQRTNMTMVVMVMHLWVLTALVIMTSGFLVYLQRCQASRDWQMQILQAEMRAMKDLLQKQPHIPVQLVETMPSAVHPHREQIYARLANLEKTEASDMQNLTESLTVIENEFIKKACVCPNGVKVDDGPYCPSNGDTQCKSCSIGYNGDTCKANVCVCPNGVKVNDGPDCPSDGGTKCKSCNTGSNGETCGSIQWTRGGSPEDTCTTTCQHLGEQCVEGSWLMSRDEVEDAAKEAGHKCHSFSESSSPGLPVQWVDDFQCNYFSGSLSPSNCDTVASDEDFGLYDKLRRLCPCLKRAPL